MNFPQRMTPVCKNFFRFFQTTNLIHINKLLTYLFNWHEINFCNPDIFEKYVGRFMVELVASKNRLRCTTFKRVKKLFTPRNSLFSSMFSSSWIYLKFLVFQYRFIVLWYKNKSILFWNFEAVVTSYSKAENKSMFDNFNISRSLQIVRIAKKR